PANATINSANLTLFMTTAPGNNRTYNAHRMTRDWTESQVTWNIAQTGTNWTTAGGDYNGTATTSTTTGTTNNVSLTWNIQADVQAWVSGTSNYGTLIKDGTESSSTARTATFASEENATSANRPQLVIDYTAPFTATLPGGSAVTMNEPSTLNFTVTNGNLTTTQSISNVTFALPYTVADGTPPPGWKVTYIVNNFIRFDTVDPNDPSCSTQAIGNGVSAVFGIAVTAPAAAAESTDTLTSVSAANDCNSAGSDSYSFVQTGTLPSWTRRGLGATMTATPATTGVNGTVTLSMAVTNRATGTPNNVAPANPTVNGATATKLTGPSPASASGGTTSNTATSNTGSLADVSAAITPSSIPVSSAATLTFAVSSMTGNASSYSSIAITIPSGFTYGSAPTLPSGWTVSANATTVTLSSGSAGTDLAAGSTLNFGITWSAVPSTAGNSAFALNFTPRGSILYTSTSATVSVNQYAMAITASPTSIAGDGQSTTTITATLTSAGSPVSGATISFTKTIGTLSTTTATTNASGQATVTLTSNPTSTDQTATVTASYKGLTAVSS